MVTHVSLLLYTVYCTGWSQRNYAAANLPETCNILVLILC